MLEPLDRIWNRNHFKISGFVSEPPGTFQNHWNNAEPMEPLDPFQNHYGKVWQRGDEDIETRSLKFSHPLASCSTFYEPWGYGSSLKLGVCGDVAHTQTCMGHGITSKTGNGPRVTDMGHSHCTQQ